MRDLDRGHAQGRVELGRIGLVRLDRKFLDTDVRSALREFFIEALKRLPFGVADDEANRVQLELRASADLGVVDAGVFVEPDRLRDVREFGL